jgi:hypothetical protein
MSTRHDEDHKRGRTRTVLASVFALAVALFTAAAVYAGLTAQATGTETVSSGTLNLTLTPGDQGAGFPSTFAALMAPGDVDNVYVNLNNTGTLDSAAGMTLWVAGSPANALTDGTAPGEGLAATITQCSVAWAGGACGGSTTPILNQAMVDTMNTSGSAVSLLNIPALAASTGQVAHLQVSLTLIGTENSVNAVTPVPSIQGLGPATLTYTFTEQQRAPVTTNQ